MRISVCHIVCVEMGTWPRAPFPIEGSVCYGVFYKLGFAVSPMEYFAYSGCLLFFRATFCKSRQSHSPLCSFLHLQNVISKIPTSSSA